MTPEQIAREIQCHSFSMNEKEAIAAVRWKKKHKKQCRKAKLVYDKWTERNYINVSFSYKFTDGAGIGNVVYVVCETCKRRKNVTDYGSW